MVRKALLGLSVGIPALTFASLAIAQTTEPPRPTAAEAEGVMDDIVVTARGREERLQDVAVSASVVSGELLTESATRDLHDLSARLPNVRIATSPTSDYLNVRGIGSSANTGFEQSVATFVDGVYRGRSRSSRNALFDVDRVEVLRGPQTTFFGNNAIAGALNITTRRPGTEFGGDITAFYSPTYGERSLDVGLDVPFSNELAARFAFRGAGSDGYIHNRRRGDEGPDLDNLSGRVALAWEPTANFSLDARYDVGRTRDENTSDFELTQCPPDATFPVGARGPCLRYVTGVGAGGVEDELNFESDAGESYFHQDFAEAAITASMDFGGMRLTSVTAHSAHDNNLLMDASPLPSAYAAAVARPMGLPINYYEDFEQFSQELRLQSDSNGPVSWMAGVYYAETNASWDSNLGFYFAALGAAAGLPTDAVAIRVLNTEDSRTFSAFASADIDLTDALRLSLGARYSEVRKEAHRQPMLGVGGDIPGPAAFVEYSPAVSAILRPLAGVDAGDFVDPTRSDDEFMPTASLQYAFSDDAMAYVSYARGFKAGGYAASTVNSSFDPELVDAYEIGVKLALMDNRLLLNVAGFYSDYQDLQESATVTLSSGVSLAMIGNVAGAVSQGVEASITYRATDRLTLRADVAYLDSHYENYPNAPCTQAQIVTLPAPCVQNLAGQQRPFAPEWSGNASIRYEHPIGGQYELSVLGAAYFSSDYFLNPVSDPYLSQEAYAKFDARIGFGPTDGAWEIALLGKNLSDERTVSYAVNLPGSPGSYYRLPDPPRSWGVQLSARF